MNPIRSICVYCGSAAGTDPRHAESARRLGTVLASEGIGLVYGGGAVGLMGVLADAVLAGGGRVVGVLPRGLFDREVAHAGLTELHEVDSMHERKQLMFDLADAFVALPGGLGTLEEIAEVSTWAQLGIHRRPIVIVDDGGYWQPLAAFFDRAATEGYLDPVGRHLVTWVDRVEDVLDALARHRPVAVVDADLTPEQI